MPIGLYLSILKPFIIPLGFTATATICLLMILKNCLRGYLLCQQLSWQNFSFYFVLNLDTGPIIWIHNYAFNISIPACFTNKPFFSPRRLYNLLLPMPFFWDSFSAYLNFTPFVVITAGMS